MQEYFYFEGEEGYKYRKYYSLFLFEISYVNLLRFFFHSENKPKYSLLLIWTCLFPPNKELELHDTSSVFFFLETRKCRRNDRFSCHNSQPWFSKVYFPSPSTTLLTWVLKLLIFFSNFTVSMFRYTSDHLV